METILEIGYKILAFLIQVAKPMLKSEIFDSVRGKYQIKLQQLGLLLEQGLIGRTGNGHKSDPFRYYHKDKQGQSPAPCPKKESLPPSIQVSDSDFQNVVDLFRTFLSIKQRRT